MRNKFITYILGILAIFAFLFGVIDAMSQRRERTTHQQKLEQNAKEKGN